MNITSLISMKGGVGKSTLTASLARSLAFRLGKNRVIVLDFDPQNKLSWHFGLQDHSAIGICQWSQRTGDSQAMFKKNDSSVKYLPFGDADNAEIKRFEKLLHSEPEWLLGWLQKANFASDSLILIDTPSGPSVYQQQAIAAANFNLAVLLPDAASYATVANMEVLVSPPHTSKPTNYIINQYDQRQTLAVDMVNTLRAQINNRLVPVSVSFDEGVREALAVQQTCLQYAPHSKASHDIDQLSQWLVRRLNRENL